MDTGSLRKNLHKKRGVTELVATAFVLIIAGAILLFVADYLPVVIRTFGIDLAVNEAATLTSSINVEEKNPGEGNHPNSYLTLFPAQQGGGSRMLRR